VLEALITSPRKFAALFNNKVPGAYRPIDITDITDMIECGLIKRYGYFIRGDLETVRAILQYEHLRQKRSQESIIEGQRCKMCGAPLPPPIGGKLGRPRVYCDSCGPLRSAV
jgi:hypothetical protein